MRHGRSLSSILVLVVLAAAPALAQEEDVLRPCRRADLIGFWRVVRFGFAAGASVDRSDPAYQMHQRYVFNSNATMTYAASEQPPTADEHRYCTDLHNPGAAPSGGRSNVHPNAG